MITVYRIENPTSKNGMWYRQDGSYDPFIKTLTEGKCADLPMDYDDRYGQRGRRWYSAAIDVDSMNYWFSPRDAQELLDAGYQLYAFEVTEYIIEEHQVIFTREGMLSRTIIPLDSIYKMHA